MSLTNTSPETLVLFGDLYKEGEYNEPVKDRSRATPMF